MKEIDESAWGYQERYRSEQDIVVGVNKYVEDDIEVAGHPARRPRERAASRSSGSRRSRTTATRSSSSGGSRRSARPPSGTDNLLPVLHEALKDRCSIGEVCGAMKDVFGAYQPSD